MVTRHFSTNEKARLCLSTNKSKHRPSDQKSSKQRTESDRISHRFEALRHIVIRGDAIFLLFLVCSAELVVLCNASFSHQVKFYSFVFMHNISTRVVCENGEHPWSLPFFPLRSPHRAISSIQTPDTDHCRYPIHDKKT